DIDREACNTLLNMTRQLGVFISEPAAQQSGGGVGMRRVSSDVITFDSHNDDATLITTGATRTAKIQPAIEALNVLRLFAGQSDPNDPSHFTIAYELDGVRGVIDGSVLEDGVKLVV